jgi:TolA-binding protein
MPRSTGEMSPMSRDSQPVMRAQTAPPISQPVASNAAIAIDSGGAGALASSPAIIVPAASSPAISISGDALPVTPAVDEPKRSALGVFGWLLLAAILFGGVGALLYVALGERAGKPQEILPGSGSDPLMAPGSQGLIPGSEPSAPLPLGSAGSSAAGGGGSAGVGSDGPQVPGVIVGSGVGSDGAVGSAGSAVAVTDEPPVKAVDPKGPQTGKHPGQPVDNKKPPKGPALKDLTNPKDILAAAEKFRDTGDWESAVATFKKLEKSKAYLSDSLYGQAYALMQDNHLDEAQALALRAEKTPGPHAIDAQILYADTVFKKGDVESAKRMFVEMRKHMSGEYKAAVTRKIVACNKSLKKPENDGIAN